MGVGGSGEFLRSGRAGRQGEALTRRRKEGQPRARGLSLSRWGATARVNARDLREPVRAAGGWGAGPPGARLQRGAEGAPGGYPEGEPARTRGASAPKGPRGPRASPPEHVRQRCSGGATTWAPRACSPARRPPLTSRAVADGSRRSGSRAGRRLGGSRAELD